MLNYKKFVEIASLDRVRRSGLIFFVISMSFITTVLIYAIVGTPAQPAIQSVVIIDEPLQPIMKPTTAPIDTHIAVTSSKQNDYVIPPVKNGLAPVISTIPTKQKVVFLSIDDGQNMLPFEFELMKQGNIKASLFLTNKFIIDNPEFFAQFISEGSMIEDHTINHKLLSHLSYDEQEQEICGEANLQLKQFGRRPILFRPPGGDYNEDTQRAAAACGMKAVVLWIAKANGGSMQYQHGQGLLPGDIVLMHFRPEFKADMQAFVAAQNAAGLHTELLENWLD